MISLTKILNDIFNAKTIPMCISESRLLCLNKDPKTLPEVSGTRPITITSVMIKLIEATGRYPSHIAGKAPMRNTGFTLKGETAMNVVRLVGR